jgi:ABC-type multidrug transport system fused ATPase/permease subunit
MAYLLYM